MAVSSRAGVVRRYGSIVIVSVLAVMLRAGATAAAEGPTINIKIKVGNGGPVFEDQAQKRVQAKNRASQIVWHCNGCDGNQPLSISFTACRDSQGQQQTCPADPPVHNDKKSVFPVNVNPELEDGTLDYVIKVGEQEVDPSIIVTRAN